MTRRRACAAAIGALMLFSMTAMAASPTTFYLSGSSTPVASLSSAAPPAGALPDFDGSGAPGRLLAKTDQGAAESDQVKYQEFRAPSSGLTISGNATLSIWVQMKDADTTKVGVLNAYLRDCGPSSCATLAATSKSLVPGGPWVETTLTFPPVNHTLASGRHLVVKLVVDESSQDDMELAYFRAAYPSRLTLEEATTTTTTTTTTTPGTSSTVAGTSPTTSTTTGVGGGPGSVSPTTDPGTGQSATTVPGETTTTTASDATAPGVASAGSGATSTSTLVAQPVSLDTEKSNLVVRTTPSQRGVTIAASSWDMSPVEGLMVSFLTAVESIRSRFATSATLGLLMTILLVIGLSRRQDD